MKMRIVLRIDCPYTGKDAGVHWMHGVEDRLFRGKNVFKGLWDCKSQAEREYEEGRAAVCLAWGMVHEARTIVTLEFHAEGMEPLRLVHKP